MTTYRIYLLDYADKIQSLRIMELPDDPAALLEAGNLLRESGTSGGIEIWAGKRIVGRISTERKSA
jgi:hypothetical protein